MDVDKTQVCDYWVHFSGTAAEELMKKAGFSGSCVVRSFSVDHTRHLVALIRAEHNRDDFAMLSELLEIVTLVSPVSRHNESDSVRLVRN